MYGCVFDRFALPDGPHAYTALAFFHPLITLGNTRVEQELARLQNKRLEWCVWIVPNVSRVFRISKRRTVHSKRDALRPLSSWLSVFILDAGSEVYTLYFPSRVEGIPGSLQAADLRRIS